MQRLLFKSKRINTRKKAPEFVPAAVYLCSLVLLLCGCVKGVSPDSGNHPMPPVISGIEVNDDAGMEGLTASEETEAVQEAEGRESDTDCRTTPEENEDNSTDIFDRLNPEDYETVHTEPYAPEISLYINEILPVNRTALKHNDDYYDAVEILNGSEVAVKLSDYCLSDSKWSRTEYVLPDAELQPGEVAVVYCTGKYHQKDEYDMPFELSYFGEKLYLCDRKGNILDKVEYPELPRDVSYSRNGDGTYNYCVLPTIGEPNRGGYPDRVTAPMTDVVTGFYTTEQKVRFTTGGEIHYTLDGSMPTYQSPVWDGSDINIDKTCSLRAFAHAEGYLDSSVTTFNYYIGEPEYELGALYVSMNASDFDTMSENYKSNCKYGANATLFAEGRQQFSIDCAISMFGCTSRAYDKKSYQLTFTTAYGPSKLRFKVFDNLDIDSFNSLVLRSGSQDNESAMMRDEFISSLCADSGVINNVLVQAYRPINLYVNGEYRGIYYIREHIDEHMIASHSGCDPEQVTLLEQGSEVKCGTEANEWREMWKFLKNNSNVDEEYYEYLKGIVDLESVADYYIIQIWCANHDLDNVREYKAAGGKWKYVLYDLDLTMTTKADNSVKYAIGTLNTGLPKLNALVFRLLETTEFQTLFLERLKLLTSTVLSEDYACSRLDSMVEMLRHDMKYNCDRWHGKDSSGKVNYRTYSGWENSVANLRSMLVGRNDIIIDDFCRLKGISASESN